MDEDEPTSVDDWTLWVEARLTQDRKLTYLAFGVGAFGIILGGTALQTVTKIAKNINLMMQGMQASVDLEATPTPAPVPTPPPVAEPAPQPTNKASNGYDPGPDILPDSVVEMLINDPLPPAAIINDPMP